VIGLLLVAAFMLGGRVPLRLGGETTPGLSFALLGLGYALRIVLLLLALRMFRDSGWVDGRVLGGTVILGALVWSLLQVAGHVSSQRPILDLLPSRGAAGPTPLSGGTTSAGRPRGKRVAK
jgi:hypothetical protein